MGLGQSVTVNLDKYLSALEIFAGSQGVQGLKDVLSDYNIKGNVTVYNGPSDGDGEILIKYDVGEGIKGVLRFTSWDGNVYEGWKGSNKVDTLESDVLSYFIGGLFSSEVSMPAGSPEAVAQNALLSAASCWVVGKGGKCDMSILHTAKARGDEIKRQIAEAKLKAEKEAEAARLKKEAEEKAAKLKAEIESYVKKGDAIWDFAAKLIKLAKEQDKGKGGIDPDGLRGIMLDYVASKKQPTTLADAAGYYGSAREMLIKMLQSYSGYKIIFERSKDLQECNGRTEVISMSYQDRESCSCGARAKGWAQAYSGHEEYISCHDFDIDNLCVEREAPHCDKSDCREMKSSWE